MASITLGVAPRFKPTARAKAPEVLQMKASGRSINEIMESLQISRASVYRAFAEAKEADGA